MSFKKRATKIIALAQVVSVLADLVKDSKYSVTVAFLKNALEIIGVTGSGLTAIGEGVNYLYNEGIIV